MRQVIVVGWHCVKDIPCSKCGKPANVLARISSEEDPWGEDMDLCKSCEKELKDSAESYVDGVAEAFAKAFSNQKSADPDPIQ